MLWEFPETYFLLINVTRVHGVHVERLDPFHELVESLLGVVGAGSLISWACLDFVDGCLDVILIISQVGPCRGHAPIEILVDLELDLCNYLAIPSAHVMDMCLSLLYDDWRTEQILPELCYSYSMADLDTIRDSIRKRQG